MAHDNETVVRRAGAAPAEPGALPTEQAGDAAESR